MKKLKLKKFSIPSGAGMVWSTWLEYDDGDSILQQLHNFKPSKKDMKRDMQARFSSYITIEEDTKEKDSFYFTTSQCIKRMKIFRKRMRVELKK